MQPQPKSDSKHNGILLKDLNEGRLSEAAQQFEVWDKAAGQVVAGLLRRRMAEEKLFKAA